MNRTITYTRSDLFDLVWSTPILKLAKEVGISDVALAKACRRVNIPLPGRGHWAKSQSQRPKQPRLPKYIGAGSGDVSFNVPEPDALRLPRKADDSVQRIAVPATLTDPEVLVAATIKAAEKARHDNGRIVLAKKRVLAVSISPTIFDRAMILLDTLIKVCRQHGYAWKISSEGKTVIRCGGHDIEVSLKERLSKRTLPRAKRDKHPWEAGAAAALFSFQEYEWISTGFLTFAVDNVVAGGARRSWADGNVVKLEAKLHEIVAGLPIVAQGIDAHEAQWAARHKQRDEEEAKRKEKALRAEATRILREKLAASTTKWERADRMRVFCDQVEARLKDTADADQGDAWLSWARAQADMIDPLLGDMADLVSTAVNVPDWFDSRPAPKDDDWWKP